MHHDHTDTWKEFEQNDLTHSAAHYLMTVQELNEQLDMVRITDIAKRLDVTAASCSLAIKSLRNKGYLDQDTTKNGIIITELGQEVARRIAQNADMLIWLFHDVLGVSAEQAEVDACKIEHLISDELSNALRRCINRCGRRSPLD